MNETLTFYGTGDEAYEYWRSGYDFYKALADCSDSKYLRKLTLSWLRKAAVLSRSDYEQWNGDPDDPHADKVTLPV